MSRSLFGLIGAVLLILTFFTLRPNSVSSVQSRSPSDGAQELPSWFHEHSNKDDSVLQKVYNIDEAADSASTPSTVSSEPSISSPTIIDNLMDIHNDSLGFEKVLMVSLPARSDKQDSFAVQARITNFSYTQIDGVYGKDIDEKALPQGMSTKHPGVNQIGCWRAHLDAMRYIVKNNIQSAVIMEDDANWDVALKHQLVQFARGSRWLVNQDEDVMPSSPYGDGWDMLWLGHCSSLYVDSDPRRWVIPNDPTVIPPHLRDGYYKPDMTAWEAWNSTHPQASNSTRVVFKSGWNTCFAAYAVSLRGAMKILLHMSMLPVSEPIDNGVGNMVKYPDSHSNFSAITSFPTIFGISRPAGSASKNSDIESYSNVINTKPTAERLQFPIRKNIDQMLRGGDEFEGEYFEEHMYNKPGEWKTPHKRKWADIIGAVGHAETVEKVVDENGWEHWQATRVDGDLGSTSDEFLG